MTTRCNGVVARSQQWALRLTRAFHLPSLLRHVHRIPKLAMGRHTQQMEMELATHHSTEPLISRATMHDALHRQPLQT